MIKKEKIMHKNMNKTFNLVTGLLVLVILILLGGGRWLFENGSQLIGGGMMGASAMVGLLVGEVNLPKGESLFWSRRK